MSFNHHHRRPLRDEKNHSQPDPSNAQTTGSLLLYSPDKSPLNSTKATSRSCKAMTVPEDDTDDTPPTIAATTTTPTTPIELIHRRRNRRDKAIDEISAGSNRNTGRISNSKDDVDAEFEWDGSLDWEYRYAAKEPIEYRGENDASETSWLDRAANKGPLVAPTNDAIEVADSSDSSTGRSKDRHRQTASLRATRGRCSGSGSEGESESSIEVEFYESLLHGGERKHISSPTSSSVNSRPTRGTTTCLIPRKDDCFNRTSHHSIHTNNSSSNNSSNMSQATGSHVDDITSRLRTVVLSDFVAFESSNHARSTSDVTQATNTAAAVTTPCDIFNPQRPRFPPASEIIFLSDDDEEKKDQQTDSDDSITILEPVLAIPAPQRRPPPTRTRTALPRHPVVVASTQLHSDAATAAVVAVRSSQATKRFKSQREPMAQALLTRYWRDVVVRQIAGRDNEDSDDDDTTESSTLAVKCVVQWSNTLRTTAGQTRLKQEFTRSGTMTEVALVCQPVLPLSTSNVSSSYSTPPPPQFHRTAVIELSTKVVDDEHRLQATLLHEICHAAAWIVDGVRKPPHGPCFQTWARRAMQAVPGVRVTTTHSYEITYKYAWACTTDDCPVIIQRQSHRSVDIARHVCGKCHGRLIPVHPPSRSQSATSAQHRVPKPKAAPSAYNLFIKEHSKLVRDQLMREAQANTTPHLSVKQSDVMKECARLWRAQKENGLESEINREMY